MMNHPEASRNHPEAVIRPAILMRLEDENIRIEGVNSAFRNEFRVDRNPDFEDIMNLLEPDSRENFIEYIRQSSSRPLSSSFKMTTVSGSKEFSLEKNPMNGDSGNQIYIEFRKPEKPGKNEEKIKSLHKTSLDLTRSKNPDEAAEIVAEIGRDELGFSHVSVRSVNGEEKLEPVAAAGKFDIEDIPEHSLEDSNPASNSFKTGKTIYHSAEKSGNGFEQKSNIKDIIHVPVGNYGVITAGKSSSEALESFEVELLKMLAGTASFIVKSLRHEDDSESGPDSVTELYLRSEDSEFFLAELADRTNSECTIENVMPSSNGGEIYYLSVENSNSREVRRVLDEMDQVKSCKILDSQETSKMKVKTGSDTFFSDIMEAGGVVKKCRAVPGELRVIIESSKDTDTVEIFEIFRERDCLWDLVRKKNVENVGKDLIEENGKLGEKLTEKQMEALREAYESGYYNRPRETTAEEIASSLGISDSTFFQHLQAAQRKLIGEFLETSENRF